MTVTQQVEINELLARLRATDGLASVVGRLSRMGHPDVRVALDIMLLSMELLAVFERGGQHYDDIDHAERTTRRLFLSLGIVPEPPNASHSGG